MKARIVGIKRGEKGIVLEVKLLTGGPVQIQIGKVVEITEENRKCQ